VFVFNDVRMNFESVHVNGFRQVTCHEKKFQEKTCKNVRRYCGYTFSCFYGASITGQSAHRASFLCEVTGQ
jgi:hypothetical protein